MALELRQSLNLSQQLIMTPQLQQAIKLLQLSRLELLESITQEMETNPILEEQPVSPTEEEARSDSERDEAADDVPDLPEVTVEDHAREDVDWESYIDEYNTGWAEPSFDQREAPPFESVT